MRWARAILALLVLVSSAAAQGLLSPAPSGPSSSNPASLCRVEGVVLKATTGEAVRKITVSLISFQGDHPTFTDVTDSNGRFVFGGLEPGRYALMASGEGYSQQEFGQTRRRPEGTVLSLAPGDNDNNLIFRMTPPGVITGTIRDEDGDPVIGGQVQALRIARVGGRQQTSSGGYGQTNDLGQYRIYGLEPGQYLIAASYRPPSTGTVPNQEVYLPTYFPSTVDAGQATPVQVRPGDEVSGIDVDLAAAHSVTIRGRVVPEVPVKTMKGIYVSVMPRSAFQGGFMSGTYGGVIEDDLGNFSIRAVPPGSYVVIINLNDGDRTYAGRTVVTTGNADVDGVTVAVGPGLVLRGRVRLSAGSQLDFSRLGVSLQPVEGFMGGAGTQVAPDGTFTLENITEGSYRVVVGGFPEEFYLQSAKLGGIDVLGPGLNVSHGDSPGNLEIVLSADGGQVQGAVLNNQQPVPDAIVVLVPDPPNRNRNDLYSYKKTDALGRFSLLGLPPGDFKLFAWEQRDGVSYSEPDLLKDYEARGAPVHIEDKTQQSVQLQEILDDAGP